jgi:protein-S-isoprenylcysteine O-methyltransferase Ste14
VCVAATKNRGMDQCVCTQQNGKYGHACVRKNLTNVTNGELWPKFYLFNNAGHLLFSLATTGYIFIGVFFEEKDLVTFYGDKYEMYQQEVPRLMPRLKKSAWTPTPSDFTKN